MARQAEWTEFGRVRLQWLEYMEIVLTTRTTENVIRNLKWLLLFYPLPPDIDDKLINLFVNKCGVLKLIEK